MISNPFCPHCYSEALRAARAEMECGKLRQQLAESQAREAALRECVEVYADKDNWGCTAILTHDHDCHDEPEKCCYDEWQGPTGAHGYELAQAALAEIAAMGARE